MRKILLVEDDTVLRSSLKEYFMKSNFSVFEAGDGEAALVEIRKEKMDAVVLDIILPKKSGYQVLEEIRSQEETKDVPVILLTNLKSAQDVERAISLGATTFLVKTDYSLEDIVKRVNDFIESKNQR